MKSMELITSALSDFDQCLEVTKADELTRGFLNELNEVEKRISTCVRRHLCEAAVPNKPQRARSQLTCEQQGVMDQRHGFGSP